MFRRFLQDKRGNYAMMVAVAMVPIMGALALSIDYADLSRQRQDTLNALDAAGIATARRIVEGVSDEQAKSYAKEFFEANLASVDPSNVTLTVVLPKNNTGGGTLKLTADLIYKPHFLPVLKELVDDRPSDQPIDFSATAEIRLKNTLEVALALDNSGSMDYLGSGSGLKRIDLLKAAAKQLVDTLAAQAALMKQIQKPVQFSLVPFAASVNVGAAYAGASWMDTDGRSPIHHENFDWTTINTTNKTTEKLNGIWYARGTNWGTLKDKPLTRFTLYDNMKAVTAQAWVKTGQTCTQYNKNGTCKTWQDTGYYTPTAYSQFQAWGGCVEARPYPYNVNDAAAGTAHPETLFVPMFGPDEPGDRWTSATNTDIDSYSAPNNYWNDETENDTGSIRQKKMDKYFLPREYGASSGSGTGPNYSCTTTAIKPLVDVSTDAGKAEIKAAIDLMGPNGATNVPEGMAWGWRTLSSGEPFTGGRPETEKGNDKVVIVLTDGANTYYTPSSLGYSDPAGVKSTYSAYGYIKPWANPYSSARMFLNTSSSVGKTDYSNTNYTKALNEQFATLCANAKAADILVMTVSLDLDATKTDEKAQMDALKSCSSDSRFRKDPADPTKPAKLYWNATGSNLAAKFKEIADELSNLRIVG
jgi:Flp pilus assembly protein TadG